MELACHLAELTFIMCVCMYVLEGMHQISYLWMSCVRSAEGHKELRQKLHFIFMWNVSDLGVFL